jgi:hypothetical protein
MKKLTIAAVSVLSLTAAQLAFADSARTQADMKQIDTQMDEQPSCADAPQSLASHLRWHDEALIALGLKLRAATSFESFEGETSWTNSVNHDCPTLRSAAKSGTLR